MRKQPPTDSSSDSDSKSSSDRFDEKNPDQLPVRRDQSRDLTEAPRKGARLVIERGADVYYSICRRIASFLNDRD